MSARLHCVIDGGINRRVHIIMMNTVHTAFAARARHACAILLQRI
jgi:hypothetical protein